MNDAIWAVITALVEKKLAYLEEQAAKTPEKWDDITLALARSFWETVKAKGVPKTLKEAEGHVARLRGMVEGGEAA